MPEFSDLKFVRIYDFAVVPRYLLEQVREIDADAIDRIYQFGSAIAKGPATLLYVLVDVDYKIKGVLWAAVDVIEACIYVRLSSLDREYQSRNGDVLEKGTEFLLNLPTGPKLKKKLVMTTTRPKVFEKAGWERSKEIRMEIENVESVEITETDDSGQ